MLVSVSVSVSHYGIDPARRDLCLKRQVFFALNCLLSVFLFFFFNDAVLFYVLQLQGYVPKLRAAQSAGQPVPGSDSTSNIVSIFGLLLLLLLLLLLRCVVVLVLQFFVFPSTAPAP
jgi:hypothetical protein